MLKKYPVINLSREAKALVKEFNKRIINGDIVTHSYSCISCGSNKKTEIFTNEYHGIKQSTVMCINCGMVFSDPRMTPESQDEFYSSDIYRLLYDTYGDNGDYISAADYKINKAYLLEPQPFDNSRYTTFSFYFFVLDSINFAEINTVCEIGAGSGANLVPFIKAGKRAYGIEISNGLVMNAKKHGIDLSYRDIGQVEEKIDLFLLIHSLEHLHDPIDYLKRLTKFFPKYILIEVPGLVDKFGDSVQNAHNFYFSENTLLKVCSDAGLSCVNIKHFHDNNWIIGIFKIASGDVQFAYNHAKEIKRISRIIRFQKFLNLFQELKNRIPKQYKSVLKRFAFKLLSSFK